MAKPAKKLKINRKLKLKSLLAPDINLIVDGVDEETGEKSVKFYGMASSTALEKYYSDNMKIDYKASEGKLVKITYKGRLEDTLLDLLGGVRSTCTYIGAKKIKDISKCTTFVCVNNQLNNYFD